MCNAGARRDAEAAHQRALAAERRVHAEGERQSGSILSSIAASLGELRQSAVAGAASAGEAKAAQLRQEHAEAMLRAAQAGVTRLKVRGASHGVMKDGPHILNDCWGGQVACCCHQA